MKRLTLVRHAQADNPVSDQQDWDRPLTARGLSDAAVMARRLKSQRLRPELMLSSPALRARQTAEVFAKCFSFTATQLQLVEELYLADAKHLLTAIQQLGKDCGHLLVVGHNPGIAEFADKLSQERGVDSMPTSAVYTVQFDIKTWQELLPGTGVNVAFDYPQRAT